MSRKKVVRNLPALEALLGKQKKFQVTQNHRHEVECGVRRAICKLKAKERISFYPMRDFALHFSVPLKTIAVVYERLSQEGILTIVRGSQTILEGKRQAAKSAIRGVVGIPVALPSFIYGSQPRAMFIELEHLLRRRGYVVDFLFYTQNPAGIEDLAERVLSHNLDVVFWMSPVAAVKETILRLDDAGVPQLVVADSSNALPFQSYTLDIAHGFSEAARTWRKAGIREVVLVMPQVAQAAYFAAKCRQEFQRAGLTTKDFAGGSEILNQLEKLPEDKSQGCVFLEHFHYEMLCNYDWRQFLRITQRHRSLFAQGLVYHSAFKRGDASVDLIEFEFNIIARRLADHISTGLPKSSDLQSFKSLCRTGIDVGMQKREF